jgi:glycosyltransferase involved in cell wall biosynthesis
LQVADLVTVTNSYLEAALRREGITAPILVIPNTIDLREWTRQPVERYVSRVGWVGMTGFRNNDLEQVGPGVRMFLERHTEVTFVHGGRRPDFVPAHRPLKVPQARMEYREQQPMDKYPRLWDWLDLAIAPISPIEFNLSKTAIKVMEGSAAGVPMLASDFGPYRDWGAVHLVPEKREWDKRLETMLDFETRKTWEAVQWERVYRERLEVRWQDWADAYSGLLGGAS